MKTTLKISLLLNLSLLAGLVFIWPSRSGKADTSTPAAGAVAVSILPAEQPATWRWSQLASTDYPTYIQNLRAVGCPEATLRAIVTADVAAAYRAPNQESKPDPDESQKPAPDFQPAPTRETDAVAATPQTELTVSAGAKTASTSPVSHRPGDLASTPVLPLVFRNVDLSALNLNAEQLQGITDLRQAFVDKLGGPNQNPNDPAYLARWLKAQPEVDNQLQGMLGIMAWETYQVATWNPPPGG